MEVEPALDRRCVEIALEAGSPLILRAKMIADARLRLARPALTASAPRFASNMFETAAIFWREAAERVRLLWAALLPAPSFLSPEGLRAHERQRRAALTAISAMFARGIGIGVNIVLVPLALRYLGEERFGLWMTVIAFTQMLSFADLGLGNGLLNSVADAYGREDWPAIRNALASAFSLLCGISALLGAVVLAAYPFLNWTRLLSLHSTLAAAEAGLSTLVVFGSFLISIPLGVIARIQSGLQEAYETNAYSVLGKLGSLAGVALGIHFRASLPALLATFLGAPLFATLLNGVAIFWRRYRHLLPTWREANRSTMRSLLRLGLQFMVLQVCVALVYSSDNVILAHWAGASQVTPYSVVDQLFALPIMMLTMATNPLWPAYTEAIARCDHAWVRRIMRKSVLFGLAFSIGTSLVLIAIGPQLVHLWTHGLARPSRSLLVAMGAWNICLGVGSTISVFLNAIGALRVQVASSIGVLVIGTTARIIACKYYAGPGLAWATTISYLGIALFPVALEVRKRLRLLDNEIVPSSSIANASA